MKPLIVANWKMDPQALAKAKLLFNLVARGVRNIKKVVVVICPPFVYIPYLLNPKPYTLNPKFGSQDCFWEGKGAFTGEISTAMLKDLGVEYIIIGHSERRRNLNETDEMVNKKLGAVLDIGLKSILCVGSEDRDQKKEFKKIQIQLEKALLGIKKPNTENLIIAYEPIWAISTTKGRKIATPKEAREGANFTRKVLVKLFGKNFGQRIRVIYGGSVDSKNIGGFIKEAKMDGVLVGAASLRAREFIKTVKTCGGGNAK